MKNYLKIIFFGFLSWLIPFFGSFPFFGENGLTINYDLFKSLMVVIGGLVGVILMVLYFKKCEKNFLKEGIIIGVIWLVMNWGLDFIFLLPMSKTSVKDYMMQIGLRYLMIPIISIGMGYILEKKGCHSHESENPFPFGSSFPRG
jgi:uncharacterized membrane protein YpjA